MAVGKPVCERKMDAQDMILDDITRHDMILDDITRQDMILDDITRQDMILDDITRKQLIWSGHVERMDPTRLPKIMIHWKPEGRKKRGRPQENLERWNIYSHE